MKKFSLLFAVLTICFSLNVNSQTNTTVDCSVGPQNVNFCYDSNDVVYTNVFTFTSADGSPLTITFNSGQVENNYDELVVFDSDGTDLNAATPYGNAGDISGLTYSSSGDTLSFTITSDVSISCQASGFAPIDVSVICATCTNPEASYSVVSDCENGAQFFVETNITNLGSAGSLTVSDNQGNTQQVSATGIVSFGPYPNTTDVEIAVANDDDTNCFIASEPLTQAFCLDAVVDCAAGPELLTYCYQNADTNVFTFTSTDGSPLRITFNSGQVENNYDELVVLDSDGITDLNAATPYGSNAGDLAGLSFQSSGDTLSFTITSDGSISCQSIGFAPIDVSVICATCTNPEASYSVVSDCVNGPQFYVETNVTSLGSAASLTILDNQGNTEQVSATGIVSLGPYANTTDVVITLNNNDDINCSINSNALTQEFCLDYVVDCNVGPTNINYCYEDDDVSVFTFTSSDGSPLNFIINSGNVENNYDELLVFDTDGTDLNAATPYGNAGDLAGISYQSTGDTISFQVASDFTINCQSSTVIEQLDISVSCATCINPIATYEVISDCANGNQFLVDVNVTSLGDAISLALEDNQGNPAVSVTTTGITQFGPYPFNTDINLTVSNEQDPNCILNSPVLQLEACPPDNDNCVNAAVVTVNDSFLTETFTTGTLQEATPSNAPNPSCGGDPDDDVWFQFEATNEYQLIALANIQGSLTNNINHAVYEGTCETSLTEISCTSGFTLLSSVTPQLTVGNIYYVRVFSNGSDSVTTTFDLTITPYVAPVNVTCDTNENLCPGGDDLYSYNTIGVLPGFGIIDCLGSSPNPTFSILEIGTSGDINIEMVQNTAFDTMGNPIGDELDVDFAIWGPYAPGDDFCLGADYPAPPPTACSYSAAPVENFVLQNAVAGDVYILLITNYEQDPGIIQINQTNLDPNSPDPTAGTLSGEIEVDLISDSTGFIDIDNDPATPSVANLCGFNSIVLQADSPFADTFEWSVNGIFDPSITGSSVTVTESNSYSVTAYDNQCGGFDTSTVIVNLYKEATANLADDLESCDDTSQDGIEAFNLDLQTPTILGTQSDTDFIVTYHETLSDAQSGTNALSSPYTGADGAVIYVRVEDVAAVGSGSGCASTNTSFSLSVLGAFPEITGLVDLVSCDTDNSATAIFDLTENEASPADPDLTVTYYLQEADAESATNPIVNPEAYDTAATTIYIRVENVNSGCNGIGSFATIIAPKPTLVQADNLSVCDDGTDGILNFDLTVNEFIIVNNQTGFVFSYHLNLTDAETSMNAITNPSSYYSMPTTIYVRAEEGTTGCFDTTTFDLELAPKPVLMQSDPIQACDTGTTGIVNFNLTVNEAVLVNNATGFVFSYYLNVVDAEMNTNAIPDPTVYNAMAPSSVIVRVEDADGCFQTTSINLELAPKPVLVQADPILGCDDDEDGISNYDLTINEAVIVNNQTGFVFTYHNTFADAEANMNAISDPEDFDSGAQTIYIRAQDMEGCFDVTSFELEFGTAPMTSFDGFMTYEVCPNATVPITIEAIADNYAASDVTITWYNEGEVVVGQTNLIIDNVLTSGTYTIEIMFNDTGCTKSEDIFVEELESCIIPQGISPNGDSINETFDLSSFDVQNLTIFNRNGVKVYEKENYKDEWRGQSMDGDELPVGTYYYVMNYQGNKTKAAWIYVNRDSN